MLLIVLAIVWVALLSPIVLRYFRDSGAEKSIESFHAEHNVLSRQGYVVPPVHRLSEWDDNVAESPLTDRRPRLTVVHADDTFSSLESRSSWDEWSDDYEYESDARSRALAHANRYAQAYASRPNVVPEAPVYEPPLRRRSMKAQRRIVFSRLVAAALVMTLIALVTGSSIVLDLAALTWFGVVAFVALALYAVSQGYLLDTSLPLLSRRVRLASVAPLRREEPHYDPVEGEYSHYATEERYEPEFDEDWERKFPRRRALG